MRYMNERITRIRSMNVGRYRHNNETFYEKFVYQISINKGRMTTTQGVHADFMRILSFLFFLSL